MPGKFITLEGTEGAGKTTVIRHLRDGLLAQGYDVVLTREPGGTPLAEELRALLLTPRDESVDADAELLMVFAARAQHMNQLIKPALARGAWVLCDRFTDSTFAYQGGGRGLSWQSIEDLEMLVQKGFSPDLTLWLDIEPSIGLGRASRRSAADRIEQETISFFERARSAFQKRFDANPERFARIEAAADEESVKAAAMLALGRLHG
ncbi:dTMP kinase [Pokkaliibacter sp. CJK22405]|uniref:dTMP kinase n=1 Tax=Pokkaliibacter sp. CJK22405 TaxID=3384615 RepID=UPI0039854C69